MSLEQWLDNAWVMRIEPSARSISDSLAIARREVADASLQGMSADGRFDHAYDAIRGLCEAALHAAGFAVPKGARKHERLIESLKFTLQGRWLQDADFLDRCRRRRHQTMYERIGVVQQRDADELLATASNLHRDVRKWLRARHPVLAPT